eukprot:1586608-Rhodomonas_salina.5
MHRIMQPGTAIAPCQYWLGTSLTFLELASYPIPEVKLPLWLCQGTTHVSLQAVHAFANDGIASIHGSIESITDIITSISGSMASMTDIITSISGSMASIAAIIASIHASIPSINSSFAAAINSTRTPGQVEADRGARARRPAAGRIRGRCGCDPGGVGQYRARKVPHRVGSYSLVAQKAGYVSTGQRIGRAPPEIESNKPHSWLIAGAPLVHPAALQ